MTGQNKRTNSDTSLDKKDTSTYTAYGDPINDTPPSINNQYQYTKATSPIADSTQSVSSGRINPNTKKQDTSAYGDPITDNSTFNADEYKQASSAIAKSTQNKNTDLHV